MTMHYSAIVIGGGQAGLSISYCLQRRGIDHLVLEQHQIAHSWRTKRWDSFCLVTPNWQCQLPGFPYPDDDPEGFMGRDAIVEYIERYASHFNPPIRTGVKVERVRRGDGVSFEVVTNQNTFTADQVVLATGGYHTPKIPRLAERLDPNVVQLHSAEYRNPESLPEGAILVVGTGQSGCQIAEDLHLTGRKVHLCVGGAPRSPRRYRGKDVVEWLDQMGYYDLAIDDHPQKETVRHKTNHYVTGRGGGREIDLRYFALEGMALHGRLTDIQGTRMTFGDDLKKNLDQADAVAESIKRTIDRYIDSNNIDAPIDPPYQPVWQPKAGPSELDYREANITSVIWCIGYGIDFSWVELPVFDGQGYPGHRRGVTTVPGLYFLGLPWLYTWGSARFSGIARDAEYLADQIAAKAASEQPRSPRVVNDVAIGS
ncbi:MSMEG_0569 family flavin-dependent oxidoreductase [Nodosilinea nodulosa]|uniref:MSMEG_0569 family flavin-dependent oxidoreductase n=1 Tax=Nodosilinea nodulosa TaxID=416001 RepID=UPI0003063E9B|nr:MSMEG_0569 family flavin-dependent oxidoreductase [Nodosilinea nodulosa]